MMREDLTSRHRLITREQPRSRSAGKQADVVGALGGRAVELAIAEHLVRAGVDSEELAQRTREAVGRATIAAAAWAHGWPEPEVIAPGEVREAARSVRCS